MKNRKTKKQKYKYRFTVVNDIQYERVLDLLIKAESWDEARKEVIKFATLPARSISDYKDVHIISSLLCNMGHIKAPDGKFRATVCDLETKEQEEIFNNRKI